MTGTEDIIRRVQALNAELEGMGVTVRVDAEAELHQRLRELLDYVGHPIENAVGCDSVPGCDRPGRYWKVYGFEDERIYDEEGFVHALSGGNHQWRHVDEVPTFRYRSPRRPLDIGWLPDDVRESFDVEAFLAQPEHVRVGTAEERLTAIFTFHKPIPQAFAERWGLEPLEVTDGYPH